MYLTGTSTQPVWNPLIPLFDTLNDSTLEFKIRSFLVQLCFTYLTTWLFYSPLSHLGPVLPSGHRQVARSQRSSHVVPSAHGLDPAPHCPSVVARPQPSVTPRWSDGGCPRRRSSPSTRRDRRQPVKSCVSTCPGRLSMVSMSLTPPTDSVVLLSSRILSTDRL